jgi:phosphatidate cytidylyltransferase
VNTLRSLTVTEQIALLFVVLFGVLALATIGVFATSLRSAGDAGTHARRERIRADLRALWIGATLFWIAWALGAFVATLLFGIVSFVALREFITLTHTTHGDHRSLILAFFVVLPLQYVFVARQLPDLLTVFIPVYVFIALPVVSAFGNDPTRFLERAAKIQWGMMVCVYGLSHAPALLLLEFPGVHAERGAFLVLYLVFVVVAAQVAQELASRRLRARPVARRISRSFSWRAWLIGCAAGGLVGALMYWATPFKAGQALAIGVVSGGCGTLGALALRAMKRDAGVRDASNRPSSITGAVGLLDRIAPLCFAAPVFFHSVRWYFGV